MNLARTWYEEGEIIHLNSSYNPVIHQRFREAKTHVVVLPLKGQKANQTKISSCYAWKYEKMARSWWMSPERGPETFLKAQIALSEVLDRQRFKTAVFCAIVASTKREPKAATFKTGGRPILWQQQFNDFKEYQFLKTVSSFSGQISCTSFSCFLVKILTKKIRQHIKSFFAKQHSRCFSFFSEIAWFCIFLWLSYQIWTRFNASLCCVIHIKISFHVWNLVKSKTTTKLFVPLCLF